MEQFERKFIVNPEGEADIESIKSPIKLKKKKPDIIRLEQDKRKFVVNPEGKTEIEK